MAYCARCGTQLAEVSYAPCPRCGNPSNGAPRPTGGGGTNTAGLVIGLIVGGLVLVAVLGIVAAIAIPNFLTAMERSKQKRTMADIRSLAIAVEAYSTDKRVYPQASSVAGLTSSLSPEYIKTVPVLDGWGTPLRYECWPAGQCEHYAIGSAGKDKTFEHTALQEYVPDTATHTYDSDVVYADGKFVQYPEGAQR